MRTGASLDELAAAVNPVVAGWINYYGLFGRKQLNLLLRRVNTYLTRWARKKYKRLRGYKRFHEWWTGLIDREPGLFVQWNLTRIRLEIDKKSGMKGDLHVPFRGSPELIK
jgi:RNA-directed DNA polymerase